MSLCVSIPQKEIRQEDKYFFYSIVNNFSKISQKNLFFFIVQTYLIHRVTVASKEKGTEKALA